MGEILGGVRFLILLSAFGLNVTGQIDRSSIFYDGVNAVGAAMLSLHAVVQRTPIFVLLHATWSLVASASLLVKLNKPRTLSDVWSAKGK